VQSAGKKQSALTVHGETNCKLITSHGSAVTVMPGNPTRVDILYIYFANFASLVVVESV